MKYRLSTAIVASAVLAFALASCSLPTSKAVTADVGAGTFHIVTSATTTKVLVAPENAGAGLGPLAGTVAAVGSCLGLTLPDASTVTVVWPHGTLALALKVGLEVPPNVNEGTPTARFAPGQPAELAGGYFTKTSWIGSVPPDCPIGAKGVFVVTEAKHPKAAG